MKSLDIVRVISLLILSIIAPAASADDALPTTAQKFEVNDHTAYLYAAPKPAQGQPWVWFAPTLKGVSLSLRKAYFEGFLRAAGPPFSRSRAFCSGQLPSGRLRHSKCCSISRAPPAPIAIAISASASPSMILT